MGRIISDMRAAAGGTQQGDAAIPAERRPAFYKVGWHPQLDANHLRTTALNKDLESAAPFNNTNLPAWTSIPGYNDFGIGNNIGWRDQDFGLYEVYGYADIRYIPGGNGNYSQHINSTSRCGELGNDIVNISDLYQLKTWRARGNQSYGTAFNFAFVNADLPDRSKALLLQNGRLALVDRDKCMLPDRAKGEYTRTNSVVTPAVSTGSLNAQVGTASYNHARNELVIVWPDATTTRRVHFRVYKDVKITGHDPIDQVVIDAKGTESFYDLSATVIPYWNGEAQHRMTPVLCDNGDVVLVHFSTNNSTTGGKGIYASRFVRNADGSFTAPTTVEASIASHAATYGYDNNSVWWGMKRMQSRDGNLVLCFSQYYYWGAGFIGLVVDKRTGQVDAISQTNTTVGYSVVHDGDDGFLVYRNDPDYETTLNYAWRYHRGINGGVVLEPQLPVSKHLWWYNATYTNTYSALLEALK